jgi:hypothetical protein
MNAKDNLLTGLCLEYLRTGQPVIDINVMYSRIWGTIAHAGTGAESVQAEEFHVGEEGWSVSSFSSFGLTGS